MGRCVVDVSLDPHPVVEPVHLVGGDDDALLSYLQEPLHHILGEYTVGYYESSLVVPEGGGKDDRGPDFPGADEDTHILGVCSLCY